jgi:hypothetical protein
MDVNMEMIQQLAGSLVTVGTVVIGIVRKQSMSTIMTNAASNIRFVDTHYADKDSDVKKLRFIYNSRLLLKNSLPKILRWVPDLLLSDKNIEKILNLEFSKTKNIEKVVKYETNKIMNNLMEEGTDPNVPSYDFEKLDKVKSELYSELGYSNNINGDDQFLAKIGFKKSW